MLTCMEIVLRHKMIIGGVIIGFSVGAGIGGSFGIAGCGTAVAGTLPFGIIVAVIGGLIGRLMAAGNSN